MPTEQAKVEALYEVKDNGSAPLKRIEDQAAKTESKMDRLKAGASKVNSALSAIGSFGMGAMGLAAVGQFADRMVDAAVKAEQMREAVAGTVYLLSSQGLVRGVGDMGDAMATAAEKVRDIRGWAREGIGDPEKYAKAWRELAPWVIRAGGGVQDIERFTRALVPMTQLYGDSAIMATERLLAGYKRIPAQQLAMLGLTREQVAKTKDLAGAFALVSAAIPRLEGVGEELSAGLDARIQKSQDRSAEGWRRAGEVWAPIITGLSVAAAWTVAQAGGLFRSRMDTMEDLSPGARESLGMPSTAPMTAVSGKAADSLEDMGDEAAALGGELGAVTGAATGATKALEQMSPAMKNLAGTVEDLRRMAGVGGPSGRQLDAGVAGMGVPAAALVTGPFLQAYNAAHFALGMIGYDLQDVRDAAKDTSPTVRKVGEILLELAEDSAKASTGAYWFAELFFKRFAKAGEKVTAAPKVHIDHIEIKLDARHQDPDRVAASVVDVLGRQATRRTQARTGRLFGTLGG